MNDIIPHDEDKLVPEEGGPESLLIANAYLEHGSVKETSDALGIPVEIIAQELKKREVQSYMTTIFMESGFRSRDKFFGLLDQIVNEKLKEAEETGIVSDEDLLTVLEKVHKMKMAELQMQIKMIELENKANGTKPAVQTNIQNNFGGSDGMNTLMNQLMKGS